MKNLNYDKNFKKIILKKIKKFKKNNFEKNKKI